MREDHEDLKDKSERRMNNLDLTKPVQTRDGQSVRIVSKDGAVRWPIVGYISGSELPSVWDVDGRKYFLNRDCMRVANHDSDLINVTTKKSGWINIYHRSEGESPFTDGRIWSKGSKASENVPDQYLDCLVALIKIEWEE